jgi:zinc protease
MNSIIDPPMALVETALSGQGGRLFFHLRDKQSLAYAVSSFRQPGLETGAFAVYLACDPGKVPAARRAIMEELEHLVAEGLTEEELGDAKQYLRGTMRMGLQTNSSQAMRMALDELYGLGYDYFGRFTEKMDLVTLKEVQRAIREIVRPESAVVVTVGP